MSPISHTLVARTIEIIPRPATTPFTTPLLTTNLVCRVVLAFLANVVCLVPLKNLCRNGEFAAVVFITTVIFLNTDTIINSLIWRDDDIEKWWRGWVWCDVHPYIYQPALTIYATSVVAIMRNLSEQVNLLRVGPLTVIEKRKRTWLQALIIFPLPIIQLGWVYPLSGQRYTVGTLKGCLWSTTPNWVCIVFFLLPIPIVALVGGFYSSLTWRRYSQIKQIGSDTGETGRGSSWASRPYWSASKNTWFTFFTTPSLF
ncbi:pheromone receptor 1 [Colletotrichum karsti]|uniref:Pheromone receptor 1 n=1 Tax=Colletotrichum karsti TaxID=1095194 RepID=A0A9P6LDF8_9PEZI|nr:pheromone receptor 1 [Colletotrichum karsti]KAF9871634.1 pheromone receptor 1 [Colletotrichum karsti]